MAIMLDGDWWKLGGFMRWAVELGRFRVVPSHPSRLSANYRSAWEFNYFESTRFCFQFSLCGPHTHAMTPVAHSSSPGRLFHQPCFFIWFIPPPLTACNFKGNWHIVFDCNNSFDAFHSLNQFHHFDCCWTWHVTPLFEPLSDWKLDFSVCFAQRLNELIENNSLRRRSLVVFLVVEAFQPPLPRWHSSFRLDDDSTIHNSFRSDYSRR